MPFVGMIWPELGQNEPQMGQIRVRIPDWLCLALDQTRPSDMDLADQVVHMLTEHMGGVDTVATLTERTQQPESAVSKSSSVKKNSHIRSVLDQVPDDLKWCAEALDYFWKHKSGPRTEPAMHMLFSQITKMAERYNRQTVHEQLQLGAANSWQSVNLQHYERYGLPKGATPTEAEAPRSNAGAYHDFTADRLEKERSEAALGAFQLDNAAELGL